MATKLAGSCPLPPDVVAFFSSPSLAGREKSRDWECSETQSILFEQQNPVTLAKFRVSHLKMSHLVPLSDLMRKPLVKNANCVIFHWKITPFKMAERLRYNYPKKGG